MAIDPQFMPACTVPVRRWGLRAYEDLFPPHHWGNLSLILQLIEQARKFAFSPKLTSAATSHRDMGADACIGRNWNNVLIPQPTES
jgi:hypothetical protein